MRDSGNEGVRAYGRAQGRQLVMEEGGAEAWKRKERASKSREVHRRLHASGREGAGNHRRGMGLGGDAQPGKESWGQAGGDSSMTGSTGSS